MVIMSIDYGKARTGLAICDRDELIASPLGVITEKSGRRLVGKIAEYAHQYNVELIVLGYPANADSSAGESARDADNLAERIRQSTALPVELMDERYTTILAGNYLNQTNVRGKKRKAVIDAVAAVIILEDYLRLRRNKPL